MHGQEAERAPLAMLGWVLAGMAVLVLVAALWLALHAATLD